MTASEMLRALDEAAYKAPWTVREDDGYFDVIGETGPGWTDYIIRECGQGQPEVELIAALRNALPQLRAVVEAAERIPKPLRNGNANFLADRTSSRVHEALTALDAALGEEAK